MIISRTPYRVSFFGGGTDYPAWFRENGGAVLATSINKYCYISARYLPPFFEHRSRIVYSKVETVKTIDEIQHPVVRAVLRYLGIEEGVEIHHDGDLPARTGIGTSSTFTVGILHALHALRQRMVSKEALAREAIEVEQVILRENVGVQDQISAAFGGLNRIEIRPDGSFVVTPVILPPGRREELEGSLLLFFTGFARTASEVVKEQLERTAANAAQLRRMYAMVGEGVEILASGGPIEAFGELLHEAWTLKRSLSGRVSTAEIDAIYDAARAAGAVGGKLLGAGGGGFILFVVPPDRQPAVREALRRLLHVPFAFESGGSQIIVYQPDGD